MKQVSVSGAVVAATVLLVGCTAAGSPPASVAPSEAAPSEAEPMSSVDAGLPVGEFNVDDPVTGMQITVTIPASGWSFEPEFSFLHKGDEVANLPEAGILLWAELPGPGIYVYGDPCQWKSTTPDTPATTVDEFAAALAAQASRDASEPVDVTVGGYTGKSLTLHVPDDAVFADCDEGQFSAYGFEGDDPSRWQQSPGQIDEMWIVDVDGHVVHFEATYRADTSAELIEEIRAIAESATFDVP